MNFILNEAAEDRPLVFSDDEEEEKITDELDDFIDNGPQPEEDISLYRQLDPENIDNYPKFNSTTCNPITASYEDNFPFMVMRTNSLNFTLQKIESVSFDKFEGFEKHITKFKKTLKNFEGSENQLFDAVIYGIMHYKCDGKPIVKEKIVEVFGAKFV